MYQLLDLIRMFFSNYIPWWIWPLVFFALSLGGAASLGWFQSPWFWAIFAVLVAVGIFVFIRWGIPKLRERRFLRRPDAEYVAGSEENPSLYREKFKQAIHSISSLPQFQGEQDPLLATPWYLLIGEPGAGKSDLLKQAGPFRPLGSGFVDEGPTKNCDWWTSSEAIVLDTAGRYATPTDEQEKSEWYWLLRLLEENRRSEPINGVLVAVPVDRLAEYDSIQQIQQAAHTLRERVHDIIKELGIDAPLYLIVTKCDRMEGFSEFFNELPEWEYKTAFGYVDDPNFTSPWTNGDDTTAIRQIGIDRGKAVLSRVNEGLAAIYGRLLSFRLTILDGKASQTVRPAIFCFPEEFKVLLQSLDDFIQTLCVEDPKYHTPLLRGVFFTSARQGNLPVPLLRRQLSMSATQEPHAQHVEGSQPYFLQDLFSVILPRDRSLTKTAEHKQRQRVWTRWLRSFLGVVLLTTLGAVLIGGFVTDRGIVASVEPAACQAPATVTSTRLTQAVAKATRCRETIAQLTENNRTRSTWSSLIFRSSYRLQEDLRLYYVQYFSAQVLPPLDHFLERSFADSREPLPLVLFLARRIQLSKSCLSEGGCHQPLGSEPVLDHKELPFSRRDAPFPPARVPELDNSYTAYLHWHATSPQTLTSQLTADQSRLQDWLSGKAISTDRLISWVNKRSPALTQDTYWQEPLPFDEDPPPPIDPACTQKIWSERISPYFSQIQAAVSDVSSQLEDFRQRHVAGCFAQWERFLTQFPHEERRWAGSPKERRLAALLLTDDSPYRRVIDDASQNLTPWLSGQTGGSRSSEWVHQFNAFVDSQQWQDYRLGLKEIHDRLEGKLAPETCFQIAREVFTEDVPVQESNHPLLRAWALAEDSVPGGSSAEGTDVIGPLLRAPVRYIWREILDSASRHVGKNWVEQVVRPLQRVSSPSKQALQMYGPHGEASPFIDQYVRPFLTQNEKQARKVFGEGMHFSRSLFRLLDDMHQFQTIFDGDTHTVIIQTTKRPHLIKHGSPTRSATLTVEETILSTECEGISYRIERTSQQIPWSYLNCEGITITVYLSHDERSWPLTKRYAAKHGFLEFLNDFSSGSHRFQLNEFRDANPQIVRPLEREAQSIEFHYYVKVSPPSPLGKLVSTLQGPVLLRDITA